jgi:hypothetical protein
MKEEKLDISFRLDTSIEEHRKALEFYNSLRKRDRVNFFVQLTKPYWKSTEIDYGKVHKELSSSQVVTSSTVEEVNVARSEAIIHKHDVHSSDKPKKRNLLLG